VLDHIGIKVSDYARGKAFYTHALTPLGFALVMEATPEMIGDDVTHAGFGTPKKPTFWISNGSGHGAHIAFAANSRAAVDAFYAAAIAAGGRDNGAPGLRPHYHANYYGAFVLDPDGNNVEAVCHGPA
jgi:catechol 2,3-dioxygenase-like lactoylglutathione lyase family enzyme